MKYLTSKLFKIFALLILMVSCAPLEPSGPPGSQPETLKKPEKKKEGGDSNPANETSISMAAMLQQPESIIFSHVKTLVFKDACMECHTSTASMMSNVALDAYDQVLGLQNGKSVVVPFNPQDSSLYTSLLVKSGSRHMPPFEKPQLTEEQKNLVFLWISKGAKKEVTQVVKRPLSLGEVLAPYFTNPEIIDYSVVKLHLFDTGCLDCHSTDGSKANFESAISYGQDMTNYEALFSNNGVVKDRLIDYVIQENGRLKKKKGSRIYRSVGTLQTMPRPKDGYDPVDSRRVKLLRLWIKNCAIESYAEVGEDNLLDSENPLYVNGKVRNCDDPAEM